MATTREDVKRGIAEGRLRVDAALGRVETRRAEARATWHEPKLELVTSPGQSRGYLRFSFTTSTGVRHRVLLHRAVWWAAGRDIPNGVELNHIDGNKLNCRLSNLELLTRLANIEHAIDTGLFNPYVSKNGMFTAAQVEELRREAGAGASMHALARKHGTDASTISKAVRGVTYRSV